MSTNPIARRVLGVLALLAVAVAIGVVAIEQQRPPAAGSAPPATASATTSASERAQASATTPASPTASSVVGIHHVWLIILENHSYSQVIGSSQAPFLNQLAKQYGLATDYHGVARPSEPNYLALISGSTHGVTDDGVHDISAPTLLGQLEQAGFTWGAYAEHVPGGCYLGASARGGPDGSGTYVRKHEPAISFTSISASPDRCANITDFSHFSPGAANFSLIIPDLCHDMHDCSVGEGDRWLSSFVPRITSSPAFADGGLLLITFDEADGGDQSQHIPLVFAGPGIASGTQATGRANHYGLLRTIESAFGLPCLANSCQAQPMAPLLRAGG